MDGRLHEVLPEHLNLLFDLGAAFPHIDKLRCVAGVTQGVGQHLFAMGGAVLDGFDLDLIARSRALRALM